MNTTNNHKRIKNYIILKTLGFGGTCKVKLGVHETTGKHVAVKIMKDDLEDDVIKYVRCEVEALQKLQHDNVLR